MAERTKLLAQLRAVLRMRHYSRATEEAYTAWVRRYVRFHGLRHPAELGAEAIAAFLTELADRQHVSASTQRQALAALLFLYRHVLRQEVGWVAALPAKTPVRLPVVLARAHVRAVLDALDGDKRLVETLLRQQGVRDSTLAARLKDAERQGIIRFPDSPTAGYRMLGPISAFDPTTTTAGEAINMWQSIHFPFRTATELALPITPEGVMPYVMDTGTWWSHVMIVHRPVRER